jgi:hypothetical protein
MASLRFLEFSECFGSLGMGIVKLDIFLGV